MGADASLTAHYSKNGRNIWAILYNNSDEYTIAVADTGNDLRAGLAKTCHAALDGVLFDFNKSTLQSTSPHPTPSCSKSRTCSSLTRC